MQERREKNWLLLFFFFMCFRVVSFHVSLCAKFFSVFNIRLMLRIITNFAPKLYLTWLVREIRALQSVQIHLGRGTQADETVQSKSNLNITCALLKLPKSFKFLEWIFSLIKRVYWRVHNSVLWKVEDPFSSLNESIDGSIPQGSLQT